MAGMELAVIDQSCVLLRRGTTIAINFNEGDPGSKHVGANTL